jgi:purine-binding chemotaxis protein CheW
MSRFSMHEQRWVVIQLHGQDYGVPVQSLREIIRYPEVSTIPNTPSWMRGMACHRERVLPLIDLRQLLGWSSLVADNQAVCDLMSQRRQDHINWLRELDASLAENREFRLATDPHKCAFGRWYDSYRADNAWVAGLLKLFDEPHQRIHATAIDVQQLRQQNQPEAARRRIEETRQTVLGKMLELFDRFAPLVAERTREIVLVFEAETTHIGFVADKVLELCAFSEQDYAPVATANSAGIYRVAKRKNGGAPVLLLENERLLGTAGPCRQALAAAPPYAV